MKQTKLSVTLDTKEATELRAVAGPRGGSSFVNEAVRQQLLARRVQRLLDEMNDEYGPVSEDVVREVEGITWPVLNGAPDS